MMTTRTIVQKRYYDEEEWFPIDGEKARKALEPYFIEIEPIMADLAAGVTIYTDVAEYRMEYDV